MRAAGGQGGLASEVMRKDALEEPVADAQEGWGFEHPEGILVSEPNPGGEEEDAFEEAVKDVLEEARENLLEVEMGRSRKDEGEEIIE